MANGWQAHETDVRIFDAQEGGLGKVGHAGWRAQGASYHGFELMSTDTYENRLPGNRGIHETPVDQHL